MNEKIIRKRHLKGGALHIIRAFIALNFKNNARRANCSVY